MKSLLHCSRKKFIAPFTFLTRDEKSKALMKTYAAAIEERRKRQEQELRRKYPLERRIKDVIVGQDGAITTVASGETSFTDKNVGKAIVIDDLPLLRP